MSVFASLTLIDNDHTLCGSPCCFEIRWRSISDILWLVVLWHKKWYFIARKERKLCIIFFHDFSNNNIRWPSIFYSPWFSCFFFIDIRAYRGGDRTFRKCPQLDRPHPTVDEGCDLFLLNWLGMQRPWRFIICRWNDGKCNTIFFLSLCLHRTFVWSCLSNNTNNKNKNDNNNNTSHLIRNNDSGHGTRENWMKWKKKKWRGRKERQF